MGSVTGRHFRILRRPGLADFSVTNRRRLLLPSMLVLNNTIMHSFEALALLLSARVQLGRTL